MHRFPRQAVPCWLPEVQAGEGKSLGKLQGQGVFSGGPVTPSVSIQCVVHERIVVITFAAALVSC